MPHFVALYKDEKDQGVFFSAGTKDQRNVMKPKKDVMKLQLYFCQKLIAVGFT